MQCTSPLQAWETLDGSGVTFDARAAQRDRVLEVPCGRCMGCRVERARSWAIRCVHESQMHERNCFLTLTYDDENLPGDRSVDVKHWQEFAKKLRAHLARKCQLEEHSTGCCRFRYFAVGEYGDTTSRAHYHALLFGQDFRQTRQSHKKTRSGHTLFTDKALTDTWSKGHVYIGALTSESADYVCRYSLKKVLGDKAQQHYTRLIDDQVVTLKPEFATQSRNPGLGKTWLERFESDVYPSGEVIFKGKPVAIPRYYLDQLDGEKAERIKQKRIDQSGGFKEHRHPDRRAAREARLKAKDQLNQRA